MDAQVLAVDTFEAHAVIRIDEWVLKILRTKPPPDRSWPAEWGLWGAQIGARIAATERFRTLAPGVRLNPQRIVYGDVPIVISPFVRGTIAHPDVVARLRRELAAAHAWLDVRELLTTNVVRTHAGELVVIDFAVLLY